MVTPDTICAVATPPGRGGVAIMRVSGTGVRCLANVIIGSLPKPRYACFCRFLNDDGSVLDEGLALFFPAPASYTGEDVLELHGHGSPVVMERLTRRLMQLGVRAARPGEFSERAFLNNRLDLTQAEAIADLIDARTDASARAAMRSLTGEFSRRVSELVEAVTELRVYVESAIDFADEEIDFLAESTLAERLDQLRRWLAETLSTAQRGRLLAEGMTLVIAGRPNAGKSSLLNRLAGDDAAIVTEVAGTTRDVLRERIQLDGLPLQIVDTAGLRESAERVEQEGVRRAWSAIAAADRLLLVIDDRDGPGDLERDVMDQLPSSCGVTIIRNKADLSGRPVGLTEGALGPEVTASALTGAGFDALADHLKTIMGYAPEVSDFAARRRHLDALETAACHLEAADIQLRDFAAGELVAEELAEVQTALGEITGRVSSEDLLGRIFSTFCIGK